MFTDCVDKVRLTPAEKAYIAAHLADWQSEPEGDYWTDNGRMNVTFSHGITIAVFRGKFRHDCVCVCVNEWRNKTAKELFKEVA